MPLQTPWFERQFRFDLPLGAAPGVLERLRGTPARLEERVRGAASDGLVHRSGGRWSAQEHVGHLWDLEPLWVGRVEDVAARRAEFRAADLGNRRTWEAGHNARPMSALLTGFRAARAELVARFEEATDDLWSRTALHPRLGLPMRLLDLAVFVAEHDDHHLAAIGGLLRGGDPAGPTALPGHNPAKR